MLDRNDFVAFCMEEEHWDLERGHSGVELAGALGIVQLGNGARAEPVHDLCGGVAQSDLFRGKADVQLSSLR